MRVGVSPKVHVLFPTLDNVTLYPHRAYDVTVILVEEDGPWVDRRHRRLRPHFVTDLTEAATVVKGYLQ